jgi:imidazolonepropionase-like amidohydrolase
MRENVMRIFVLWVLMLLPLASPAEEADKLSGIVVISPVHVISMETGEIAAGQVVIVRDGLIRSILSVDDIGTIPDASLVDGENGFLIPGLAEMHAHIPSHSRGEQYARDILMLYLANGITTARGMLGEPWHLELREALATQKWTGPRLVTSGPSFNGRSVSSPEQAADMARSQAATGYDFLKLHPGLKPAEFEAIADTAHASNTPFAGHVSFEVGLYTALRRHQATIDHLDGYAEAMVPESSGLYGLEPSWFGVNLAGAMEPSLARQLASATAAAGVWNIPTQSLLENLAGNHNMEALLARPGMAYVSDELKQRWVSSVNGMREQIPQADRERFLEVRRVLVQALQNAGAGLLLGSDAPQIMNVPGFSIHEELGYLADAGLTPLQSLQSGTRNVAIFLGEENSGDIKPGFVADLVLLRANPLENISATSQILGVMKSGAWFGREQLDSLLAAIEGRGI